MRIGSSTIPTDAIDPSTTTTPFDRPSSGARYASPVGRLPHSPFSRNTPELAWASRPSTGIAMSVPEGALTRITLVVRMTSQIRNVRAAISW